MKRTLAAVTAAAVLACEGRELPIFDVPVQVGGSSAGSGGASGGDAGSSSNGAGTSSGAASGGSGGSDAGAGGSLAGNGGSGGSPFGMSGGGGSGGFGASQCTTHEDCAPGGWICEKLACDDPTGVCVPRPAICRPEPDPVCGCDGVTYWNDCIRQKAKVQRASWGQCTVTACACNVGEDCNVPFASCSHLVGPGEVCGHNMGSCWVLPPQCVPGADSKMWRECRPPDVPPGPCVDTCLAIFSQRPHAELRPKDICN
jgi:hypothetical protein